MYRGLMVMICCMLAYRTLAQPDSLEKMMPVNEWYFKVNPLALLEVEGGLGLSVEYIAERPKLGFQLEVQPIFLTAYGNNDLLSEPAGTLQSAHPFGIELRPELRYYMEGIKSKPYIKRTIYGAHGLPILRRAETRAYIAADFLYKYIQVERLGAVTVNNGGTTGSFNQNAVYKDVKRVLGYDVKLGAVASLSNLNRVWIELFAGVGIRYKKYSYKNLPTGASLPIRSGPIRLFGRRGIIDNTNEWQEGLSLPAGIKIVYCL